MSATVGGTSGRRLATGGRRAFPAGTGSEEPSVLNKAGSDDVAEQALRALHTEQLRHRIREALAALPADQRQAVKLHLFEEMSDGEIAPLLGVTAQRASQLWRAGFVTLWSALRDDPVGCQEDGERSAEAFRIVAQQDIDARPRRLPPLHGHADAGPLA